MKGHTTAGRARDANRVRAATAKTLNDRYCAHIVALVAPRQKGRTPISMAKLDRIVGRAQRVHTRLIKANRSGGDV